MNDNKKTPKITAETIFSKFTEYSKERKEKEKESSGCCIKIDKDKQTILIHY